MRVNTLTHLLEVARKEGTQQAIVKLRHHASERFYEWRFGVQTDGGLTFTQRRSAKPTGRNGETTDYATLFRFLGGLTWQDGRELFIEFGCGKGRVLLVAAMQSVRRVIGVEVSTPMSAIARRNIQRARGKLRCQDIEVVNCSAETYAIPPAPLTIFFGNSFGGGALEQALENIQTSFREHPRPIRVIAAYPPESELDQLLAARSWLFLRDAGNLPDGLAYRIMEVVSA